MMTPARSNQMPKENKESNGIRILSPVTSFLGHEIDSTWHTAMGQAPMGQQHAHGLRSFPGFGPLPGIYSVLPFCSGFFLQVQFSIAFRLSFHSPLQK